MRTHKAKVSLIFFLTLTNVFMEILEKHRHFRSWQAARERFNNGSVLPKKIVRRGLDSQPESSLSDFEIHEMQVDMYEADEDAAPVVELTISEINTDSSGGKKFIELYIYGGSPPENALQGYNVLLVRGHPLQIVLNIDVGEFLPNHKSAFVVIGDSGVENLNVDWLDERAQASFGTSAPDMDQSPFAYIITFTRNPVYQDLLNLKKKDGIYVPTELSEDDYLKKILFDISTDVAVVGRRVWTNQCTFFTQLFPPRLRPETNFLLRDWDDPVGTVKDYSLNYCCDDKIPFTPSCFKLGIPTPGRENDCNGRKFVLEFIIDKLPSTRQSSGSTAQEIPSCSATYPGVSSQRYSQVEEKEYHEEMRSVLSSDGSCSEDEFMDIDLLSEDVPTEPTPEQQPVLQVSQFNRAHVESCSKHFTKPHELFRPPYSDWIEMSPQGGCRITCRICKAFFAAGWWPEKKHRSYIQQHGFFSNKKYVNRRAIKSHLKNDVHIEAMEYYNRLKASETVQQKEDLVKWQQQREMERLRPSMNEVQLAYAELRARSSFNSHKIFMTAASAIGANIGTKHRTGRSLSLISSTLSYSFHQRLLEFLVKENKFFSLICDGTTNRQVPLLVCLISTLEDGLPIIYFWRLIALTGGEVAANMVEDVKRKVGEDDKTTKGFESYFKTRIIASVSDSASNMVGVRNSFHTHLRTYVGRDIAKVRCSAHLAERAVIHAIDFHTDQPSRNVAEKDRKRYFKSFSKVFDAVNNQFCTYYMSRGSKRFQHLVDTAAELDLPIYRINYFFDVRWSSSHKRCMEALYNNYDALRADLESTKEDGTIDENGKSKATELLNHLEDKTTVTVIAEFIDFLTVLETMSTRFQKRGGTLIGLIGIVHQAYSDLETLRLRPGKKLEGFLQQCSCPPVCAVGRCTLTQYDNCKEVLKGGQYRLRSRTDGTHTIKLSQFRNQLYTSLQKQLQEYFDPQMLQAFDVFNPANFKRACPPQVLPTDCSDLSACYESFPSIYQIKSSPTPEERLSFVCNFFGIVSCTHITNDWKVTLAKILTDGNAMKLRGKDPEVFWAAIMKRDTITFSSDLRGLLERVLTTAFSSADSERAFSLASNLKTADRTSLSTETLQNLVRLSFNGPPILSDENLFAYTKEFVKASSAVDDETQVGGRPSDPSEEKARRSKLF